MSEITNHPFFADWPTEDAAEFCKTAEELEFEKGRAIFNTGDNSAGFFLILEGTVAFYASIGGVFREVDRRGLGEVFGEVSMLTGNPHRLRAVAEENCRAAFFPTEALNKYMGDMPKPLSSLMRSFARHIAKTSETGAEKTIRQDKMATIGQMVNNIVHDFKSPFQMIALGAETIGRISNDRQVQKLCASITEQVARMLQMATELSEFSKGQAFYNFQEVNLRSFMEDVRAENEAYVSKKGAELAVEASDNTAWIEPRAMSRVFQNIVCNAADAMPEKGGEIAVRAIALCGTVEITVTDNGCGIPEKIRATLWEPFVTAGKKNGTGLGTAIVKSIVEGHGGTIGFTTETGKGTTFAISLPRFHKADPTAR